MGASETKPLTKQSGEANLAKNIKQAVPDECLYLDRQHENEGRIPDKIRKRGKTSVVDSNSLRDHQQPLHCHSQLQQLALHQSPQQPPQECMFKKREDFTSDKDYGQYVKATLQTGMCVRARVDYESVSKGDYGIYKQSNHLTPPAQFAWDGLGGDTYWVYWHMVEILPMSRTSSQHKQLSSQTNAAFIMQADNSLDLGCYQQKQSQTTEPQQLPPQQIQGNKQPPYHQIHPSLSIGSSVQLKPVSPQDGSPPCGVIRWIGDIPGVQGLNWYVLTNLSFGGLIPSLLGSLLFTEEEPLAMQTSFFPSLADQSLT